MKRLLVVLWVCAPILTLGCRDPLPEIGTPDSLTLYSLDGESELEEDDPRDGFHGFPVLGRVDVTARADRRSIISAVESGIAESDGTAAKCFWPRHGISVVEDGKTIDLVICFECLQLRVYSDGSEETRLTTRSPQAALNRVLTEAQVPLAPGMLDDTD